MEIGKMVAHRRDAFVVSFSVTDVFAVSGAIYGAKASCCASLSPKFQENLRDFIVVSRCQWHETFYCGCIGARTTAFKTTSFDEVGLQKNGIAVESFDLSELIFKVNALSDQDDAV